MASLHTSYGLSDPTELLLAEWDNHLAREHGLEPPGRWHMVLRRSLRSATVAASTAIEGNPLSLEQVQDLLTGGTVDAGVTARREVLNYNEAMDLATRVSVTPGGFTWTQDIIRVINATVMRDLPGDTLGEYRTEPLIVAGVFTPPDQHTVPSLMQGLAGWLQDAEDHHPLIRSALVHLNLAAIHPFADGNGRTARILSSLELMRAGLRSPELINLETYLRLNQHEYFDRLAETLGPSYAPERHEATPWIDYYVRTSVERLEQNNRVLSALFLDMGTLLAELERSGSSHEWAPFLLAARLHPLRASYVASVLERSPAVARALLSRMVSAGWLERRGRARATHYVPGQRLADMELRVIDLLAGESTEQQAHESVPEGTPVEFSGRQLSWTEAS
jgi:Fic family protein